MDLNILIKVSGLFIKIVQHSSCPSMIFNNMRPFYTCNYVIWLCHSQKKVMHLCAILKSQNSQKIDQQSKIPSDLVLVGNETF